MELQLFTFQVSVYLQNWSHVLSYVNKAEATPQISEVIHMCTVVYAIIVKKKLRQKSHARIERGTYQNLIKVILIKCGIKISVTCSLTGRTPGNL